MSKSKRWQVFQFNRETGFSDDYNYWHRLTANSPGSEPTGTAEKRLNETTICDNAELVIAISEDGEVKVARKKPIPEPKHEWVFDDCDC